MVHFLQWVKDSQQRGRNSGAECLGGTKVKNQDKWLLRHWLPRPQKKCVYSAPHYAGLHMPLAKFFFTPCWGGQGQF